MWIRITAIALIQDTVFSARLQTLEEHGVSILVRSSLRRRSAAWFCGRGWRRVARHRLCVPFENP